LSFHEKAKAKSRKVSPYAQEPDLRSRCCNCSRERAADNNWRLCQECHGRLKAGEGDAAASAALQERPQYIEEEPEEEFQRGTEEMHNHHREGVGESFWPTLGNRRGDDTHSNDAAADLGEVLHVEENGRLN
jgi:hypothetical protein